MKKIFFTVAIAAVFAFAMTACNNNQAPAEANADTAAVCEETCNHECEHNCVCADSTCKAQNCENCANRGTENCCKVKAGKEGCCDKAEACEHKCDKAGACDHKCDKAGEHKCEHKCEHAK